MIWLYLWIAYSLGMLVSMGLMYLGIILQHTDTGDRRRKSDKNDKTN